MQTKKYQSTRLGPCLELKPTLALQFLHKFLRILDSILGRGHHFLDSLDNRFRHFAGTPGNQNFALIIFTLYIFSELKISKIQKYFPINFVKMLTNNLGPSSNAIYAIYSRLFCAEHKPKLEYNVILSMKKIILKN